jgi:hypothetical protein
LQRQLARRQRPPPSAGHRPSVREPASQLGRSEPAGRERLAQIELARSQELINDVPNFTNGQPVIQIGDVVASSP